MNKLMLRATVAIMLAMVAIGQPAFADTTVAEAEVQHSEATYTVYKPTVQDVLIYVCKARGYGHDCAKTLLGMLWTESNNVSTAIGDHGAARGYFQIHYKLHNISTDCAEDIVCSADWTITYMERHGYPKYTTWAVQCHNSCGVNNGYAAKAARHAAYFWDKPLDLSQEAPLDLSQVTQVL